MYKVHVHDVLRLLNPNLCILILKILTKKEARIGVEREAVKVVL